MNRTLNLTLAALASVGLACSGDQTTLDGGGNNNGGGTDAATTDGGDLDGGVDDGGDGADGGEMDAAPEDAGTIDPNETPYTTIRDRGSSDQRVDIVFIGDGYTLEELSTRYVEDVDKMAGGMFATRIQRRVNEPFRSYRDLFNAHRVHVASNESGIDEDGMMRDTALDGRDGCNSFGTTCYGDPNKIHDAVEAALVGSGITADWIVLVLNTENKVAGIIEHERGNIAVIPGNFAQGQQGYLVRELGLRELARAYCNAAYEFWEENTMYDGPELDAVNVTVTATAPKWVRWDGFDVEDDRVSAVSAYEGGAGFERGIYRPTEQSKMGPQIGTGTLPYNAVVREAIILEIYNYVPLIISKDPVEDEVTDPIVLFVQRGVGDAPVEWTINGMVATGQTDPALGIVDYARLNNIPAGTYTVTAKVLDDTDWVRIEPRTGLEGSASWTVTLTQ